MSGCVWGCKKIYWANITFGHDTQILRFLPVPSLVRKNDNNWKCLVGVGVSGWCMDGIWGWLGPSGLCLCLSVSVVVSILNIFGKHNIWL